MFHALQRFQRIRRHARTRTRMLTDACTTTFIRCLVFVATWVVERLIAARTWAMGHRLNTLTSATPPNSSQLHSRTDIRAY